MCYNEIRFSITLIIILKNLKNWDHILDIFPKETEKLVEAIYTGTRYNWFAFFCHTPHKRAGTVVFLLWEVTVLN